MNEVSTLDKVGEGYEIRVENNKKNSLVNLLKGNSIMIKENKK